MQENESMMPRIKGRGWVEEAQCGCAQKGLQWQYEDFRSLYTQLLKEAVLTYPVKNIARFDSPSRVVTLSVALALHDAGMTYAEGKKQHIGLLGTNPEGALASNLAFFRDYVEHGRKLARGNLFIYTLPTSPLAEAAIHFGLDGPLLYSRDPEKPEASLLAQAELMIQNKESDTVLAVVLDPKKAACHVMSGDGV